MRVRVYVCACACVCVRVRVCTRLEFLKSHLALEIDTIIANFEKLQIFSRRSRQTAVTLRKRGRLMMWKRPLIVSVKARVILKKSVLYTCFMWSI